MLKMPIQRSIRQIHPAVDRTEIIHIILTVTTFCKAGDLQTPADEITQPWTGSKLLRTLC